uniref:Voltage-dependent calcium channel subunit alpha-2/delta-3-like n=1 Tax=Sinocyclocheilus anshuiensis TaxID=1608454 RepID=A0A671LGI2_9TELE
FSALDLTFGGEMKSLATKYSGSQLLQKKYKELEQSVRVEEIDGIKLVKKLAGEMEQMFHKKAEAIKVTVFALIHKPYDNTRSKYEYFNAVLINEMDEEGRSLELGGEFILQPNEHFNNLSVNLSLSVVQVPTNMYNKDSAIVNGVYWSEALNTVFVDNFKRDPSLIWQYFGSAKGFFRQYPGEFSVVFFSFSHFLYAGSYNEELHYVEPCLNGTLVQADVTNKDHFRDHLDKLFAKGIGMLDVALTEAFELLSNFNETGRGSVCSQAIMLVTDGAVETYDAVFAQYNWPDRKVRVFPYLIGRESAFADNLKWMACANKGYFTQISTLADVQENVMEYLHVLSRPKVIDREHDMVWTEAYVDNTRPQAQKLEDAQGPVLMTTVAMPVFSTKNETRNKGILLGVVGTDVPVSEILKAIPKYKLGIHGYAFAITNNGYILTHPDLQPLYEEGKKRRKSSYSSVDLSEVEWEDKEDELRNAMVNRQTGSFSMKVKKTVDKGKRVLVLHNDYYYTDIKGTPFSLGVALSRGHGKYFFRGNTSVEEGLHDLEHPDVLLANEWTYCNTEEHPEHNFLTQIDAIKLYFNGEPHLKCDKDLIQEVLFDAVVTAPLEAYWTSLALNKSENSDKGVEIAYLCTRTGLSRINLFVMPDQLTNQDFLTGEDKEVVFSADHFPLWYKRAAEQVPGTFIYSLPFGTGSENKSVVLASSAIHLLDERESPIAAAVGIQMKLEFFQRKFWTASRQCAALDGKCSISCDNDEISCYLIDNNGFIIVAEDLSLTGVFFGEAEGAVMSKLVSMGSFKSTVLLTLCFGHFYLCISFIHLFIHIYMNSFLSFQHLLSVLFSFICFCRFLVEFNLYSWWHSDLTIKAQRGGKTMLVPCDKEYPAFVSERTIKETVGNIDCESCVKSFVIQQIPSSNLFMVVIDNTCDCSDFGPVNMDPIEIMYILNKKTSLKCERLKFQKERRRPDTCHPFHHEENSMECGGSVGLTPSLISTVLIVLIVTIFPR